MFKCICLILRSRLTVTISSGNNISLHDICIVLWPNDAPISPHLMFCLMSALSCCVCVGLHCSNSVCSVSASHVSTFYICITISSHNHTATAAGHGKHSYLCQDTWDVIHRTGSQKALLHCICTPASVVIVLIRDPWAGHIIHILLRSLHWTPSRDNDVQQTQCSVCSKCTLLWLDQAPSPSPDTVPH